MKNKKEKMRKGDLHAQVNKRPAFFKKPIPFLYLLLLGVIATAVGFWNRNKAKEETIIQSEPVPTAKGFKVYHEQKPSLVRPLLFVENKNESSHLLPVKRQVNFEISTLISEKVISKASVYVNVLNQNQWFAIHPEERFIPASLLKIPYLLIYLRMSETDPTLLDRKFTMTRKLNVQLSPEFRSKTIEQGKPYAVRDLLRYMIAHSDNNATFLLHKGIDYDAYQKLFADINMPPMPDMSDPDYKLTVFDYSRFFQILYNATYLNPANSEYALTLLTQCDFTPGMLSGVPEGTVVAHKFGESGTMQKGQMHQLHESGIIYLEGNPLIVTIFTEGREMEMLPGAIARITKTIVRELQTSNTAP